MPNFDDIARSFATLRDLLDIETTETDAHGRYVIDFEAMTEILETIDDIEASFGSAESDQDTAEEDVAPISMAKIAPLCDHLDSLIDAIKQKSCEFGYAQDQIAAPHPAVAALLLHELKAIDDALDSAFAATTRAHEAGARLRAIADLYDVESA